MDIRHGFHLFRDGDARCAVGPEVADLQKSPAGFGATKEMVVKALQAELRKAGYPPDPEARRVQGARAMTTRTLILPREQILPAWRAAVLGEQSSLTAQLVLDSHVHLQAGRAGHHRTRMPYTCETR